MFARLSVVLVVFLASCSSVSSLKFANDWSAMIGEQIALEGVFLYRDTGTSYLFPHSVSEDLVGCVLLLQASATPPGLTNMYARCAIASGRLDAPKQTRVERGVGIRARMVSANLVSCASTSN